MRFSRVLTVIGLLAGAGGAFMFQGCSSSDSGGGGGGTTGGVGAPPTAPNAPKTTSTTEHNFAVSQIFLGDTTRSGQASPTAWKDYGYNLDGKVSTKDSTDVCKPPGNNRAAKDDGTNGIDNSFGNIILPFITSVAGADAPAKLNAALTNGDFTIMLDVTGLSDDPAQTNTGLTGFLNAGGAFSADGKTKPTFTTADNWPVRPELLSNKSDPRSSTVQFPSAFVTNGLFVNGAQSDVRLSLVFSGQSLDLTIHKAVITFQHAGSTANNGTIAGIIDTTELINNLKQVAGHISPSLCGGDTLTNLLATIGNASDMMTDGSQDPNATCNAISAGIGFVAKDIAPPSKVGDLAPQTKDPCATGGGDAGADAH